MNKISSAAFRDTKAHYPLLDGLRGVAALLVIWYHVFEGFAFAGGGLIQHLNHGYLAVDFFFMLSGFVIAYAYDDRLRSSLSLKDFFKRRLIRLHPMVVVGSVLGALTFCIQGCVQWSGASVPFSQVMVALLFGMFLIPAFPGMPREVRGNGEMFPLNGPCWSLFFEYIGNFCYALFIQRFSTKILGVFAALSAVGLSVFALTDAAGYGSIGVGWTIDGPNLLGGFLRMICPFTIGMLLSRIFHPVKVRGAFWICSALLLTLFSVPYIPAMQPFCMNGLYEMFCILLAFPVLVWLGASGATTDVVSTEVCRLLGDISYPIYVVHYPVMYLFYAWLIDKQLYTLADTWDMALLVFFANIFLAFLFLKLYDEPVRRWLTRKIG